MIILPESSAHGLIVHVGLVLMKSPQSGDGLTGDQLEDSLLSVAPLYKLWTAIFVLDDIESYLYTECRVVQPVAALAETPTDTWWFLLWTSACRELHQGSAWIFSSWSRAS